MIRHVVLHLSTNNDTFNLNLSSEIITAPGEIRISRLPRELCLRKFIRKIKLQNCVQLVVQYVSDSA